MGSRRSCEQLIESGRVSIDGAVASELGVRVSPDSWSVTVDGRNVRPESIHHIVLYKPRGYLCTSADPGGRPTFHDLLPDVGARLYSAGRLDTASEGLILVTNDGSLVQKLTHPGGGYDKVYLADLDEVLEDGQVRDMAAGILIDGRVHRAERVRFLGRGRYGARYEFVLRQGLNRQIRRMAEVCGRRVRRLVRIRFGPIELGNLRPGEWRRLSNREIESLRQPPVKPARPTP